MTGVVQFAHSDSMNKIRTSILAIRGFLDIVSNVHIVNWNISHKVSAAHLSSRTAFAASEANGLRDRTICCVESWHALCFNIESGNQVVLDIAALWKAS